MIDLYVDPLQQDNYQIASSLAFWLANASEILHFIQHDQDLGGISQDAQDILQECVKDTFMWVHNEKFVRCGVQLQILLIPNATKDWTQSRLFLPANPGNQQSCLQENSVRCMLYETGALILIAQDCAKFCGRRARAYLHDNDFL